MPGAWARPGFRRWRSRRSAVGQNTFGEIDRVGAWRVEGDQGVFEVVVHEQKR